MSKEANSTFRALKLALDALEINNKAWKALADSGDAGFWEAEEQPFYELSVKAITALREALAEPDFWEGYVPEPVKSGEGASATVTITLPAPRVVDCHATGVCVQSGLQAEQPAQQEPVAHFGSAYVNENGVHVTTVLGPVAIPQDAKLYTSPPAQQEPVGSVHVDTLAMLPSIKSIDGGAKIYPVSKAKYDAAYRLIYTSPQRIWQGLTNNELQPIADEYRILFGSWVEDFARSIEAKLRSKNDL
jgi:hypothetical protein